MLGKTDIHTFMIIMLESSIALFDEALGIVDINIWIKIPAYLGGIVYMVYRTLKMRTDWMIAEIDRKTKEKNLELLDQVTAQNLHSDRMKTLQEMVDLKEKRQRNA